MATYNTIALTVVAVKNAPVVALAETVAVRHPYLPGQSDVATGQMWPRRN